MPAAAKEDGIDVSISWLLVWSVTGCAVLYRTRGWWPKLDTYGSGTKHGQQVRHYLCFLEMCRNLFCVLTLVSWPWILPRWGLKYFPFFLPRKYGFDVALTADLDSVGILTMCSMTVFTSVVAFYFITRFQQETMSKISTHDKETRALWLSHIPVQDQATLQQHEVTLEVLTETIQEDLQTAITNHIRQGLRSATPTGTMVCPLGGCPCSCYIFGCNLACTLVCSCCPRWNSRPDHPGGEHPPKKTPDEVIEDLLTAKPALFSRTMSSPLVSRTTSRTRSVGGRGRSGSHSYDAVCLEEIAVQPVMDKYVEYIRRYQSIKDAIEREETFGGLMRECQESQSCVTRVCGRWWYARQQRKWCRKLQQRRDSFMGEALGGDLKMSGHAFVVFRDPTARDFMLEPRRRWWELRDHSPFRFGRPPFSSVTLQCRQAPHPTDLQWQNLHVGMGPVFLRYLLMLTLMVVVTFVVVSVIALSSELDDLKDCLVPASDLNKDWPRMCRVSRWAAQNSLASQLPTLVLLSFNSSVLPLWIEMVSKQRKFHLYSLEHISQMRLNLGVMVLSKTWVPLLSLVAVKLIIAWVAQGDTTDFSVLPGILSWREDVVGNVGVFYIKYVLNCAFVSNIINLLQLCRHCYRKLLLCCWAVTARDKSEANACFIFAWGYWYAWSLSIAANGLIMGVAIPSLLPVCALNFATKHFVDKCLFDEAAFNPGPDSKGIFPPRVAHYMFLIIALKMLLMGVGLLLFVFYTDAAWWTNIYFAYFWVSILFLLPVLLWVSARVSLLQQQLNEGFTFNEADTYIYKIGCKLTQAVDYLMMFRQNGASRISSINEPLMTRAEDLTWDAPRVMVRDILAGEPAEGKNDELRRKLCRLLGLEEAEGEAGRLGVVDEEMARALSRKLAGV